MIVIGAISRARLPSRNIMPKETADLAKDDSILVLPADKSKATVVMDKADYDAKMELILNDESTYQPLKKDPTTSLEKMNARLLQLSRMDRLPSDVYSKLRSSAGRIPLLYGLLIVHKPSVPLRPIVSFVSSSTYHLSQFLADLLAPVVGLTSSHVKNSKTFVEFNNF